MSNQKRSFAQKVADAVKDNVKPEKVFGEIGKEMGRLAEQGKAEVAGALFNGSAFVPYGEGQKPVKETEQEKAKEAEKQKELEKQQENEGLSL